MPESQPDSAHQSNNVKASPIGSFESEDSTPAILKLLKNQSKMGQSFIIASMQRDSLKAGGGSSTMGGGAMTGGGGGEGPGGLSSVASSPIGSLFLGRGTGRSASSRPKWKVNEVSGFTPTGSELVKERNIVSVAVGINHMALLTGVWL